MMLKYLATLHMKVYPQKLISDQCKADATDTPSTCGGKVLLITAY